MPLPTDMPEWCTDPDNNPTADIVAPSAGIRAEGWNAGDKVPAQFLNWWQNLVGQWLVALRALITMNWLEHSGIVKGNAAGDRWTALACGVGAQLGRQVVVGYPAGAASALAYYRTGTGAWAAAGTPPGDDVRDVASGAGLFVGVIGDNHTWSSPTGNVWTDDGAITGVTTPRAIAFDGTTDFVVVGDTGQASACADGTSWGSVMNLGGDAFREVAFGAALWVAGGDNGLLRTASDPYGVWTSRTATGFGADGIKGIAYDAAHGSWCIVGDNGKVATSTDGATWVAGDGDDDLGTADLVSVDSDGAGTLLAVSATGDIFASYDGGQTWEAHTPGPLLADDLTRVAWDSVDGCWAVLGVVTGVAGSFLRSLRA